jgi:hypothetical protein
MRGTASGSAAERQAASTAMGVIDAMLATLHTARAGLVAEIRQADDAALAGDGNGAS